MFERDNQVPIFARDTHRKPERRAGFKQDVSFVAYFKFTLIADTMGANKVFP